MKELKGYNYSPEKQQPQQFWPVALSSRFSMLILRIFNILFKAHSIFSYIFIIYKNKIRSISYSPNSILYQKISLLSKLTFFSLAAQCCILYRNQTFDLLCKSNHWCLYEMQHSVEKS